MTRQHLFAWILTTLREAAWAPLGVVGIYGIGLIFGWFDDYPALDMPTHFLGGMAITYFYQAAIRNAQVYVGTIPPLVQVLFAVTSTGTTTVLWEIYENLLDHFFGTHTVRNVQESVIDMALGLAGAVVLVVMRRSNRDAD